MAAEDGTAMFGMTASGIPLSHLDYSYVGKCSNAAELEKILKVLRSGEEGNYPDLIKFTENRLATIHPKSKALRKEIPIQSYSDLDTSEREQVSGEFEDWFSEISLKDSLLKKNSNNEPSNSDFLPPIRSARTVGSTTSGSAQVSNGNGRENKKRSAVPRGYQDWDKFNPDDELQAMEENEEKELNSKQEKAKINSKEAEFPSTIETAGKTDEELKFLAEHEKNKGNDAFHGGDYKESLVYYSRSIQYKPSAAAYNNRAFAELKLEKYDDAILDCNMVISLDPNNLKAFLRRAIAYKSKGDIINARKDFNKVLEIEPNNKRAKELLGEMKEEKGKNSNSVNSHLSGDTQPKKKGKRLKIVEIDNDEEGEEKKPSEVSKDQNDVSNVNKSVNGPIGSLPLDNNSSSTTSPNTKLGNSNANVTNDVETNSVAEEMNDKERIINDSCHENNSNVQKDVNEKENKQVAEIGHREISVSESQPPRVQEPMIELPGLVVKVKDEGTSLFKLGRYAEAAEKFTAAVEILEKDKSQFESALASLLYNRAACLNKMGDASGCIKDCNASLDLIPGAVKPLVKRAASQEMLERYKLSYLDYEAALSVDSSNKQAQDGKSRVVKHLFNIYGPEWRSKVKDTIISSTPVSSELLNAERTENQASPTLNVVQDAINNSQKKTTKQNSSTKPSDVPKEKQTPPPAMSDAERFEQTKEKGNAFVKQGKFEQAISCYTDCIGLDPNKVVSYTNRALCYLKLHKYQQAVEDASKALDFQPDNVKALYRRALARKGLREFDSAAKDLLNLVKMEPTNTAGKKELDVVLNMCREERREKQKSAPQTNNEEKHPSKTTKAVPANQQGQQNVRRRRRVQIEEVNGEEDSDDESKSKAPSSSSKTAQDSCPLKARKNKSTASPSTTKPITNNSKPESMTKPKEQPKPKDGKQKKVKLNKATPYDFYQAWNSVSKKDYAGYADILRQIQPPLLPKVLSNKLDADMLRSIARAVSEHILPKGEEKFSFDILQNVCKAERFDMALMFLDTQDAQVLRELFSRLDSTRLKEEFVNTDTFNSVLSKYKIKA